jgi:hypothetical protein
MPKKLHELSEKEIVEAINQVPAHLAVWMKDVGIKFSSDVKDCCDICEPVKNAILDKWLKARES